MLGSPLRAKLMVGLMMAAACTSAEGDRSPPGVSSEPTLRWPQLGLHATGGRHGGRWSLTIDRDGRYLYASSDDDGSGQRHTKRCTGQLDAARAQAWLDRLAAVPLTVYDEEMARRIALDSPPLEDEIVNEALVIVLEPREDVQQMPADAAAYLSVRTDARAWFLEYGEHRPANERCE